MLVSIDLLYLLKIKYRQVISKMGAHFSDDFKDGMYEYMEGRLPRFAPLILRVVGGALAAIILIVYMPNVPIIIWIIGALLCILPAFYCTVLDFGDEERVSDAISSIQRENKGIGFWKGVGLFLLFLLIGAIRTVHWIIAYAFLGGIAFLISIIF